MLRQNITDMDTTTSTRVYYNRTTSSFQYKSKDDCDILEVTLSSNDINAAPFPVSTNPNPTLPSILHWKSRFRFRSCGDERRGVCAFERKADRPHFLYVHTHYLVFIMREIRWRWRSCASSDAATCSFHNTLLCTHHGQRSFCNVGVTPGLDVTLERGSQRARSERAERGGQNPASHALLSLQAMRRAQEFSPTPVHCLST